MRTLYIDLSADQTSVPKLFGGYEGEHNETQVKVKLPSRLLPAAGVAQYRFNYETADGRNVYSSEISPSELGGDNHDEVTTLLTQTVTLAPTLNFCVCGFAYDEQDPPEATLIGKSQAVSLIIRDPVAGSLDGTETDPIAPGPGAGITIDDEMSSTSENPVQNKVIFVALSNLAASQVGSTEPTTATVGKVGDLYVYKPIDENTATVYVCIEADETHTPAVYTWVPAPDLSNYVQKTDIATTSNYGLMKFPGANVGIARSNQASPTLSSANETAIKSQNGIGQPGWGAITPSNIQFLPEALGLPSSQVGSTEPTTATVGKVGDLYVYKPTDENTATIYVCVAVDETQNPAVYTWVSAPDLADYVKKTDIATTSNFGVVKAASAGGFGVEIVASGPNMGQVRLSEATETGIKNKVPKGKSGWGALTPNNIHVLPEALGLPYSQVGATPPTTATVGKVGDLYVYKPTSGNTTTVYVCDAADKEQTPAVYTWMPTTWGLATVKEVDTPPHTGTNASTDPGTVGRFGDIQVYIHFSESSGHQSFEGAYLCVGKLYDPNKGGAVYTWAQIA